MKAIYWGTRGSLACPGPETQRYGGNTSCVEVIGREGTVLVLDAGTGIRRLGSKMAGQAGRIDILLSHLHLDHIIGLGFFAPLFIPGREVHIWGPASITQPLAPRLMRYLGPPFFPVHLRELPCDLTLHEVPDDDVEIGEFRVSSMLVSHPGPSVGYRITDGQQSLSYLPDHEPALGVRNFPLAAEWTSGYKLAEGVDLLIHDGHYEDREYLEHVGWGHSSISQTVAFAQLVSARHVALFHHDPTHVDEVLDRIAWEIAETPDKHLKVTIAAEGAEVEVAPQES